jgi:hypothetical protein
LYAHVLSGYAVLVKDENGRGRMVTVAGVADKPSLDKALELYLMLLETARSREGAHSPPWLETKFDQIYALHVAAKLDSKMGEVAKAQIVTLQGDYGGAELPLLKDADLLAKYRWLIREVN